MIPSREPLSSSSPHPYRSTSSKRSFRVEDKVESTRNHTRKSAWVEHEAHEPKGRNTAEGQECGPATERTEAIVNGLMARMNVSCASLAPKLFFTVTIISILALQAGIIIAPYIVLYFHSITFLPLFIYRIVTYWQQKQQLFLLDPCYIVNIYTIIIIWAQPENHNLLQAQFGLAMGPLFWAPIVFRNSLVLNDVDRMTSCYIHVLPPLTAFAVRWMSKAVSDGWYAPLASRFANETEPKNNMLTHHYDAGMWIWVVLVPILYFWLHMTIYVIIVHMLCRPPEAYMDSFTYMRRKDNCIGSFLRRFNGRNQVLTYWLCMCFIGTIQFLVTPVWYCFLLIHIVSICLQFLVITWNGATYHVDVYKRVLEEVNVQKVPSDTNQMTNQPSIELVRANQGPE